MTLDCYRAVTEEDRIKEMKMIIKEIESATCQHCGATEVIRPAQIGCDTCKTPIENEKGLEMTVFTNKLGEEEDNSYMVFCSWVCVLRGAIKEVGNG